LGLGFGYFSAKNGNIQVVCYFYPETSIFLSEMLFRGKWLKRPLKTEI